MTGHLRSLACALLGHPPAFLAEWRAVEAEARDAREATLARFPAGIPVFRRLRCDRCGLTLAVPVGVATGRALATTAVVPPAAATLATGVSG